MNFRNFGTPKPKKELEKQAKSVEKVLGKEMYPPDSSLDISTIKEKYKTRYEAYLATLRALRQGEVKTDEIRHAKEWIKALNNLDAYITEHESKDNPLLREKQYIVFKKIRDFLEQGKRKGYVKLPTGTGKTILFSKIAEALDMRTLVVSPSKIILHQNAAETEEFTDSEFGKYYTEEKDLGKKVTHITYNSLVNTVRDGKINPDDVPVLILDEAHRSLGPERTQAINKFNGLQLGFTATSEFSGDKKVANLLEEEIFRMDVAEGIREGLICDTQTIHAYTNVDLSSVDIKEDQYNQEQLEKVINVQGRNLAAVELYQKKFSNLKAICNCSGVKHAQAVAKLFNQKGIPAACITGNTPKDERIKILEDYKNGAIKVLTNAKVLLEGFNAPSCSVTFNLHPTLSLVDAEQRARSGRLDKNNPNKWSYVVDFIDQNSKKPQVLYSEILKADRVSNTSNPEEIKSTTKQEVNQEKRSPINFSDLSINGLQVTIDTRKIMEVTKKNLDSREKWTFATLQTDVREKNIISSHDYVNKSAENNWPGAKFLTSLPEFPKNSDGSNDWDTYLGKERKKEWTFKTLQADVRSKGIKSSHDYPYHSSQNNWPSPRFLTSWSEFPKNSDKSSNWNKFLGKEEKKEWTFGTLQADVRAKGIKSSGDYANNAAKNKWPGRNTLTSMSKFPQNRGSKDWYTYLGLENINLAKFKKIQAEVRAKDIKSASDYDKNSSENDWPTYRTLISMQGFPKYPDGSPNWDAFFGRKSRLKK